MIRRGVAALMQKNLFGSFLDTSQRGTAVITKNGEGFGIVLSAHDVEPPFGGDIDPFARAPDEARIDRRLAAARAQILEGNGVLADDKFFNGTRTKIRDKFAIE